MKLRKSDICILLLLMFPVCNLIGGALDYYDEFIGVFSLMYIFLCAAEKRLSSNQKRILILLMVITIIGIISNMTQRLIDNYFAIAVDILWLWKIYAAYIASYQICISLKDRNKTILQYSKYAKAIIIFMIGTVALGQFIDIGTRGEEFFLGIFHQYLFFWNNGIQTGWLVMGCMIPISLVEQRGKRFYAYLGMAVIVMGLTTSSLVYCWIFCELALLLMIRENKVFKWWYFALLGAGVMFFAWADIQTYFVQKTSGIRITLLQYGVKTANTFFPLGSGFATYGSDMAARFYSKLYILYGWENSWALGRETGRAFLNDNFFASIIGQFGWFGFVLYLIIIYSIYLEINTKKLPRRTRITALATVITIAVVMIGSASVKSMMGTFIFCSLGYIVAFSSGDMYIKD